MVEQEYRAHPAISQSQLKLLLGPDPSLFNTVREPELYFEEKKHFIIGDAVDCQLTKSVEEFNNKFHISNLQNKPSDTIKSIVNQVYDHVKEIHGREVQTIDRYSNAILDSCNDHNYQPNWKTETRIAKVVEAWEYWEDLKQAEGKVVLSTEENNLISQIVMSIRTNPITAPYFKEDKDVEIRYQVAITFTLLEVECKALLDMIIIDHNKKTVQPIDIKTMGDQTLYFPKSLRQRRYDIQAAFYTRALLSRVEFQDYEILPFKFIVESTTKPGNPLVFTCNDELLSIGRVGREEYLYPESGLLVPEIKGFHQLIEDYKWYVENGFEEKREVVEAQGELEIDWNGIINF